MPQRNQERLYRDRRQEESWEQQTDRQRDQRPYEDYGWNRGQSVLPQFRDRSIHLNQEEQVQISRQQNRGQVEDQVRRPKYPQGPFTGIGPKNYRRSDDRIKEEICERLTHHGQINARQIEIHVQDGEVTLEGQVDSRHMKRLAELTVENIRGIKDIHNRLKMREQQRSSEQGLPGGGTGRVDEVGRTGIYPASGPLPESNAEVQTPGTWGQGEQNQASQPTRRESEPRTGRSKKK
jgi:osmotically-inducible protein OsmY